MAEAAESVRLEAITKRFDQVVAVDALSLVVRRGEFACLLGPSGCGKTTTLRIIAGFVEPDEGTVALTLAETMVMRDRGRVEQIGRPREVYARPRSAFVADFLGRANFLAGRVTAVGLPGAGVTFVADRGEALTVRDAGTWAPGTPA